MTTPLPAPADPETPAPSSAPVTVRTRRLIPPASKAVTAATAAAIPAILVAWPLMPVAGMLATPVFVAACAAALALGSVVRRRVAYRPTEITAGDDGLRVREPAGWWGGEVSWELRWSSVESLELEPPPPWTVRRITIHPVAGDPLPSVTAEENPATFTAFAVLLARKTAHCGAVTRARSIAAVEKADDTVRRRLGFLTSGVAFVALVQGALLGVGFVPLLFASFGSAMLAGLGAYFWWLSGRRGLAAQLDAALPAGASPAPIDPAPGTEHPGLPAVPWPAGDA